MKNKDIILFVGSLVEARKTRKIIDEYGKTQKRKFRIALIYDKRKNKISSAAKEIADIVLPCVLTSDKSITQAIKPYTDELYAATCRGDVNIPYFQKVIPHIPYVRTATVTSLSWATNKLAMRKRFEAYDSSITPPFMVVHDSQKATLKEIESKVGFPLVVKPNGLEASVLVNVCYHHEELQKTLRTVFRKIGALHKKSGGRGEPTVLVEQLMEGQMYSIDAYINSRGTAHFCPPVHVKTGSEIGFDDFFGYRRITPTQLSKESIAAAEESSFKALRALGLRSTTAHIELLKTEAGWKIIEVGPRMGGFRGKMYKKSFNIDHILNDIRIHIPEKPVIPKKVLGYTAVMQFFAKKEGSLSKLTGIKKAQELKSFDAITIKKKIGDRCLYAKNGGKSVFDVILFNKDRSNLLADIRRLEQMIEIETTTNNVKAAPRIKEVPSKTPAKGKKKVVKKKK
jgi:biotin carboxylase